MPPHACRRMKGPPLSAWRGLLPWFCAFSLLIVLASRVPRFSGSEAEASWVRSVPPQMTAKLLTKDFFLLQPASCSNLAVPRVGRLRSTAKETQPLFLVSLDNPLLTRPPPAYYHSLSGWLNVFMELICKGCRSIARRK